MNIVFYGGGNIAQAVAKGFMLSSLATDNIFYIDRNKKNKDKLKKLKIKNLKNESTVHVDIFILAVKPKDAINAYKDILDNYKSPKVISFVAGIKTKRYLKINKNIELLRAMPNTSSEFGLGITGVYNATFEKNNYLEIIDLFERIGEVVELEKESHMDTFTGMIGSGPAYFFYLLKAYEKKLMVICDHDQKKVNSIILNLMWGVGLSISKDDNLNDLIASVASKKGTTEAGLKSFKSDNLNKVFEKGLIAAIKRSKESSNEF